MFDRQFFKSYRVLLFSMYQPLKLFSNTSRTLKFYKPAHAIAKKQSNRPRSTS